ncbi:MAG TPA: uroporphyrinogen-III C-methyltransferase [Acetobacteraceae bacterium]|nr:uroporphyrinogen-III C-methyltransferase [Acetobacteraceae bacterium]
MTAPALALAARRLMAPDFEPGSVWLAGAGPGDPGLLTLHAAHALAVADVVLHDALVPADLLVLAATPHLVGVGKRAGGARIPQLRINARMIALARRGLRVLRLKSGDPLIFGRGGEEAMALAAARVPFRIVPGISAGIGGAASAGIPLTHRLLARSIVFATGHDARGNLPEALDFAALACGADVLVFYMGLRQAGPIAARLIAAGRTADEAVAFVADGTTSSQHVTLASLATAAATAAALPQDRPTLIVIGPVLALRDVLAPLQQAAPMTVAPASADTFAIA